MKMYSENIEWYKKIRVSSAIQVLNLVSVLLLLYYVNGKENIVRIYSETKNEDELKESNVLFGIESFLKRDLDELYYEKKYYKNIIKNNYYKAKFNNRNSDILDVKCNKLKCRVLMNNSDSQPYGKVALEVLLDENLKYKAIYKIKKITETLLKRKEVKR